MRPSKICWFLYEVIQHDLSADLGVIGPPGAARSVTVKAETFSEILG